MFKRIVGARSVSLDDIPVYMEDFDDLEEYYFSKKHDQNAMKDARLRGLYEYTVLLKPPENSRIHIPYRLLSQLASVAPEHGIEEFVLRRLVAYGLAKEQTEDLTRRIQWASTWARRQSRPSVEHVEATPSVAKAIKEFADNIRSCKDGEQVQAAAFAALRSNGLKPTDFFPVVYSILLGSDRGPRLGPYVMDSGAARVSERLVEALEPLKGV
jgi:lysyl-tRNA synthetase class 1